MSRLKRLNVLFAAEALLPPIGGAERLVLELLERLAERNVVRAAWLNIGEVPEWLEAVPATSPTANGYWQTKARRREALGRALERALARRRADVVVTQLHAAPAAVEAAKAVGAPSVLLLPSYESLCKHAFDVGSLCQPDGRCQDCPAALALSPDERLELVRSREAHEQSLRDATVLVAPSRSVADACEAWCERRPLLIAGSAAPPPAVSGKPPGPVVAAAARWSANKGASLLEPIARGLERRFLVTESGLEAEVRSHLERLPHVELVPEVPLAQLLQGASLLIVPSQWREPFGRVAFEGLAAGIPTLASATGGLLDFVPPEQLVSDYSDPQAWIDAIARLEPGTRWEQARLRGLRAAQRLLAEDPAAQFEQLLWATAHARREEVPLR